MLALLGFDMQLAFHVYGVCILQQNLKPSVAMKILQQLLIIESIMKYPVTPQL